MSKSIAVGLMFFLAFVIEIFLQVFRCQHRFDSALGDIDMSHPKDGVEDELAGVFIAPIPMEVAAGIAEAASATRALTCPSDVLRFTTGDHCTDGGIALVRSVAAVGGAGHRHGT